MSLFTFVRQFVLFVRGGDANHSYGGNFNNASNSEDSTNEQAEWMAIRELAQRAEQYEHENYDGGDE